MKARAGGARTSSLLIDLAACTAVVDGARVELPPTEFALLATLAARPGELVPSRELVQLIWPNDPVMNTDDLRWHIWNLRKRIGDRDREHKVIGNRRGLGYFLDLRAEAVQVFHGSPPHAELRDTPVALDQAVDQSGDSAAEDESSPAPPTRAVHDTAEASSPHAAPPISRRGLGRSAAMILAAMITSILLASSWAAGYWLSQRSSPATPRSRPPPAKTVPERRDDPDSQDKTKSSNNKSDRQPRARTPQSRERAGSGVGLASEGSTHTGLGNVPQASKPQPSEGSQSPGGSREKKPPTPPPPPQPNAVLYHLVHPDSGDHYMTTSSSAANRKQAEGYVVSTEGRVFGARMEDTVAIAVDSGSAFIYRDAGSAPREINVYPLYRLTKDGDLFYTVSSSLANQAQAQGWTRSTPGYVAT